MKAVNKDSSGQAAVTREIDDNMALLPKKPESKLTYLMSVSSAEERRIGYLKFIVTELLDKYGGEIAFSSFQDFYKDKFKVEWKSHYFGLTDLDQLCHILKDIVMVEVNSSGKKVMKPVNKDSSGQAEVTRETEEIRKEEEKGYLKFVVKELLDKYGGEIAFSSFEDFYKDKFKIGWKPHCFGLTDLDQLCDVLKDIVMVEVNSSGKKVIKAVNKDSSGEKMINPLDKYFKRPAAKKREVCDQTKIQGFYDLLHNPNTFKIDDVLERCPVGIAISDLSRIEVSYQLRHRKSPDYMFFGVRNIQELFLELGKQKKVLLLAKPESKQIYLMSFPVAESKQKGLLKYIVKELLDEHGEIPFRFFEDFYENKVEVEWNSFDYGLTDLDQLCDVLKDIVMVVGKTSRTKVMKAVNKDSSGEKVTKAVNKDSSGQAAVTRVIEEKMTLPKKPESKETYVTSVSKAEERQIGYLKFIVKELLDKYGGEIAFCSFEDFYKDKFKVEWKSHDFGLTDLDQLCHVLKDIVMVEVNSLGKKVMKPVDNNSSGQAARKRKVCDQMKIQWFYDLLHNTCMIDEVLERCPVGIAMSELSHIEVWHKGRLRKSPAYMSFGGRNIQELCFELDKQKKVVLLKKPESKEMYVMSVPVAESKQKGLLRCIVKELLDRYGEIPFRFFKDWYEFKVEVEWNSFDYGLTDLDQLCDVLKDLVMVAVRPWGTKVMKAVNKDASGEKVTKAVNIRRGGRTYEEKRREMNEKIRGLPD